MHSLYHSQLSLRYPRLFCIYVIGSLAVLRPDLATRLDTRLRIALACSMLLSELLLLDNRQPRLTHDLVPIACELPIELVARIVNSKRISKLIAEQVSRLGELQVRSKIVVRYDLKNKLCSLYAPPVALWMLIKIDGVYRLELKKASELVGSHIVGDYQLCSVRDEARIRNADVRDALQGRLRGIDAMDEVTLCCHIVLFARELCRTSLQIASNELATRATALGHEVLEKLEREN